MIKTGQTRWVRLPVDCLDEEWICDETSDVKVAFLRLLFYAEMVSTRGGVFKRLPDSVMARKLGVSQQDYNRLIEVSEKAQSRLTVATDSITVNDWDVFHPTSAKRTAAWRDRQDETLPFTECDACDVTSPQEKKREEKRGEEKDQGASRPIKSDELFAMLPPAHQTPELLRALRDNFVMRSERKMGGLGEKAIKQRVDSMSRATVEECIRALDEATASQWKGVFPKVANGASAAQGMASRKEQLKAQREAQNAA